MASVLKRRMDMDMDMDDMNDGTFDVEIFPQVYLTGVAIIVALFMFKHVLSSSIAHRRLTSACRQRPDPARPRNVVMQMLATIAATYREIINASLPSLSFKALRLPTPSLGAGLLVGLNFAFLITLCFYGLDPTHPGRLNELDRLKLFQNLAYRCGFVSLGQMPIIFVLAGKNNIVGWLTGSSYERLNWIHRWCSRCLLVTVTMHMGYWFADWSPFGGFTASQLTGDDYTKTGFASWFLLLWIVFSSFAPIRGWRYEFFVIQHIVSILAFTIIVFQHVPSSDWAYLWPAVAFLAFDRTVRFILTVWRSFSSNFKAGKVGFANSAELTPLAGGYTKITVPRPSFSWSAGQHVYVGLHSVAALQSHPFTIASLPSDGRLEFIVRAHQGSTRKFLDRAEELMRLPTSGSDVSGTKLPVVIDGPYGSLRPLRQFDSVVLIAGGVGSTFTVPLLRDLVYTWQTGSPASTRWHYLLSKQRGIVTRKIRMVWVSKSRDELCWFATQLNQALADVAALKSNGMGVDLDISLYVTCDETYTSPFNDTTPAMNQAFNSNSRSITYPTEDKDQVTLPASAITVEEVDPRSISPQASSSPLKTCGPNGTCCCQTTIKDEADEAISRAAVCRCNCSHDSSSSDLSSDEESSRLDEKHVDEKHLQQLRCTSRTSSDAASLSSLHAQIKVLSGRPHVESIVRASLEQARGETGVVVCGPRGLNEDVRRSVVGLSDERAVHKGSGAQGIWLHEEGFGL